MKRQIGKVLKRILPIRWYKLIANGFIIVPAYYNTIIKDAEKNFEFANGTSVEKEMLLLRKYAHIIDKGLHRQDAEPGHSTNYYRLLKGKIDQLSTTSYAEDPSFHWAQSKIELYELLQQSPGEFTPLKGKATFSGIGYDDLFLLMQSRRSCRYFKEAFIEDEIISKLIRTVNWAPNSCNKQPIRVFYTNDPQKAVACLKCCRGGTGFGSSIPSFFVFTADVRGYVYPTEMYLPAIDVSLGMENFLLAGHTLQLSGCILTWAQKTEKDEEALRSLLNIPNEYSIVCNAVMGYAELFYQTPIRKNR